MGLEWDPDVGTCDPVPEVILMHIKVPELLVGSFQEVKQLRLTFSALSLEKHRKPSYYIMEGLFMKNPALVRRGGINTTVPGAAAKAGQKTGPHEKGHHHKEAGRVYQERPLKNANFCNLKRQFSYYVPFFPSNCGFISTY